PAGRAERQPGAVDRRFRLRHGERPRRARRRRREARGQRRRQALLPRRRRRRRRAAELSRPQVLQAAEALVVMRPDTILDAELESRPAAERIAYLEDRLRRTVAHACLNAPRFRAAMSAAGLAPHDVTRLGDLARLPLTAK